MIHSPQIEVVNLSILTLWFSEGQVNAMVVSSSFESHHASWETASSFK